MNLSGAQSGWACVYVDVCAIADAAYAVKGRTAAALSAAAQARAALARTRDTIPGLHTHPPAVLILHWVLFTAVKQHVLAEVGQAWQLLGV